MADRIGGGVRDVGPVKQPVAAVLAVVMCAGQVLLVKRRNPPDAGLWGFAGGKVEFGETVFAAAERELYEETRVRARARCVVDVLDAFNDAAGAYAHHYILIAVLCEWREGEPCANDDASDAAFFGVDALAGLAKSKDVMRVLVRAGEKCDGWWE